jgi:RND family efflux transporter MFP subunit
MRPTPKLLAAAILLASCSPDAATPEKASDEAPVAVRIAEVIPASLGDTIEATGTVRLRRETDLGFTTAGHIASIVVNEGDRVRKGQLLAALDTTMVGADYAAAIAERNRASAELQRTRDLFAKGWLTRARLDTAEAAYRSSAAMVDSAAFADRTARIFAPADGVILRRVAEVNQVVAAGTPVITFGDANRGFVLQLPLTDRQTAGLSPAGTGMAQIDAIGPDPIPVKIVEIAGRADPMTGTFNVEVALPANPRLRSGQIGSAALETNRREVAGSVMTIPGSALFAVRADEAFVYVVDMTNRSVQARKVVPGATTDRGVQILSGLQPGERVAVTGIHHLRAGARVAPSVAPPA